MASGPGIDYEKLAAEFGGKVEPDYESLAKEFGGTIVDAAPVKPLQVPIARLTTPKAQPKPIAPSMQSTIDPFASAQDWLPSQPKPKRQLKPSTLAAPEEAITPGPTGPIAPTVETKATGQSNAPVPGRIPGMERLGGAARGVPTPRPIPATPPIRRSIGDEYMGPTSEEYVISDDPTVPAFVRGASGSTVGMAGGLMKAIGESRSGSSRPLPSGPNFAGLPGSNEQTPAGAAIQSVGESLTAADKSVQETFARDASIKDFMSDPKGAMSDPRWWMDATFSAAGSMAPMVLTGSGVSSAIGRAASSGVLAPEVTAAAVKYGPAVAASLTESAQVYGSTYNEARAAGLSPELAREAASLVAAGTGMTAIPAHKVGIFNDQIRSLLKRAAVSAAAEGGQEGVQTWIENLVAKKFYDPNRPLLRGVPEAVVGASLTGTTVGAGGVNEQARNPEAEARAARARRRGYVSTIPQGPSVERLIREDLEKYPVSDRMDNRQDAVGVPPPMNPASESAEVFARQPNVVERNFKEQMKLRQQEAAAAKAEAELLAERERAAKEEADRIRQERQRRLIEERRARREQSEVVVPETGPDERVLRVADARDRLANLYFKKPFADLSNPDRVAVDELVAEGLGFAATTQERPAESNVPKPSTEPAGDPEVDAWIESEIAKEAEQQKLREDAKRRLEWSELDAATKPLPGNIRLTDEGRVEEVRPKTWREAREESRRESAEESPIEAAELDEPLAPELPDAEPGPTSILDQVLSETEDRERNPVDVVIRRTDTGRYSVGSISKKDGRRVGNTYTFKTEEEATRKKAELEKQFNQSVASPLNNQPQQNQQVAPVAPANQPVAENEPPAPAPVEAPAPLSQEAKPVGKAAVEPGDDGVSYKIEALPNGEFRARLVDSEGNPFGPYWTMPDRESAELKGVALLNKHRYGIDDAPTPVFTAKKELSEKELDEITADSLSNQNLPSIKIDELKNGKFKVYLADGSGDPIGTSWTYADRQAAEKKGNEMLQEHISSNPPTETNTIPAPEPREEVIQNTAESPAPGGVDAPASPGPVQPVEPAAPARVDATPTPDPDVFRVPTSSLAIDPVRFQYKVEGIGQGGVNEELKSAKKWNPKLAGVIAVWRDPQDGKTYVVNGHHRFDLASRLNVPELKVWFIDAPDAQTARAEGALMNIAEGRGTAIDAAKFMRDTGRSAADMEAEGVSLKGAKARDGAALANLAPSLFDEVVHGGLKQERAVIIGEGLPNHEDQLAAIAVLRNAEQRGKRLTNEEVKELIRRTAQAERKVEQQDTLFGVQEMTQNLALEEAQLSNFVRTKLGNEKKLFSTVGSQSAADRLGAAGNKIDADTNRQIAQQADQALAVYDKLSLSAGPISDALREGARRVASGEKLDSVKESVYSAVRDSVARLLGQNQQAGVRAADRPAVEDGGGGAQEGNASGAPATGTGRAGNRVEQTPDGPQETLVTDIEARESQLAAKRDRTTPLAEVPFSLVQEDGPPAPAAPDDRQSSMFGDDESTPAFRRDTGNPAMRPGTPRPAQTQQTQQPSGTGRMISRSEIVKELSEMLNDLPIRTGNIAQRGAEGIFKVRENVVRTQKALDLETISHEIGHGLHKYLWGTMPDGKRLNTKPLDQFKGELGPLDYDQTKKRPFEGFAEYIRLRLTDPQAAQNAAPQFHAWFENTMSQPQHADMKQVLDDARDRVQRWIQQPGAAKVAASINVTPEKKPLTEKLADARNDLQKNWVDKFDSIKKAVDLMARLGGAVKPEENAFILARLLARSVNRPNAATGTRGTVDAKHKVNGEGLATILRDAAKRKPSSYNPAFRQLAERDGVRLANDGLDDLRLYLVAKRAEKYHKDGLETGFEESWVQEAINSSKTPEIEALADRIYKYQGRVLQYMIDKGALSKEFADRFRKGDEFYVPMYRVMDNSKERSALSRKMIDLNSPIMRRKGSTREIIDPLESIYRNTYEFMSFADRNEVAQALVKQAAKVQDQGWLVESGIVRPMKRTAFNLSEVSKEIKDILKAEGIDASDIDFDQMAAIYRPNMDPKRGENIVRVIVDGKPKLFQFDPALIDAMDFFNAQQANLAVKFAMWVKNISTGAFTSFNPTWAISNFSIDQLTAATQSRNGYKPFVDAVWGLFKLLTDKKLVEEWELNGGGMTAMEMLSRPQIRKNIREMAHTRHGLILKNPMSLQTLLLATDIAGDLLTLPGQLSEKSTRVAEFWLAKRRGKGAIESVFDSNNVSLDFARSGRLAQNVNRFIPFFSVFFNATDRTMEMMRNMGPNGDPEMRKRAWATAGLTAMASLALWLANKDDEKYRKQEHWLRDMYWLIPARWFGLSDDVFGPFIRIQKQPHWGLIFGSSVERAADSIIKQDPNAFEEFDHSMWDQLLPPMQAQFMLPIIEGASNYSFFTNRQIESDTMQKRSPVNRYTNRTSEFAKETAEWLNRMGVKASPVMVEHFIYGFLGGSARDAINTTEELIGAREDRPATGPEDRMMIRALSTNANPWFTPDYKRFNKVISELEQKHQDFKYTKDTADKMTSAQEAKLKNLRGIKKKIRDIEGRIAQTMKAQVDRKAKRKEVARLLNERDEVLRKNRAEYQK